MAEAEKHLPTSLKVTSSVVTATVAILAGMWGIDNHYASAKDVDDLKLTVESQIRAMRQERTEDEISRLVAKKESQRGKLSPEDTAQYDRLMRRIAMTNLEQKAADMRAEKLRK